jgi:uncharacterized protein (TIGR03437 family)
MLSIKLETLARVGLLATALLASANADPKLRLTQTAVELSIAVGSNGLAQTVDAFNAGDGTLALQVSSTATWAIPSVGEVHACNPDGGDCIPIQIALQTSTLAKGPYTAFITVADPNAIDAPQYIVVTVHMGGTVPDMLTLYAYPGQSVSTGFSTASPATITAGAVPWLSVAPDVSGTFTFGASYRVTATASTSMNRGDYSSSITVAGSSFPADNKTFPVLMSLGDYVEQLSPTRVVVRAAPGARLQADIAANGPNWVSYYYSNAITVSGGNWLQCCALVDATGLSPGTYEGSVFPRVIRSPGTPFGPVFELSTPSMIPVEMAVIPSGPPAAFFGGATNNATFSVGENLAQGDIVALFGEQFISGDPVAAMTVPLPNALGGTQVFVNDNPVPLYYVSYGQINFQLPYETVAGEARVRVDRKGVRGNTTSIMIAPTAPRILIYFSNEKYGYIVNQNGKVAIPSQGVKVGDTLTIYSIGLGPTSPAVTTGEGAPASPLANAAATKVCFNSVDSGSEICADASFAGLTPKFVGLYQVNVVTPPNTPKGDHVKVRLAMGDTTSNIVEIALQ